jgi:hypothetical protein
MSEHLNYRHASDWLIIQPLAVLIGVICALVAVQQSEPIAQLVGQTRAIGPAAQALATLPVRSNGDVRSSSSESIASASSPRAYSRDVFGYQQTDDDGDGCPIREDILARDLTHIRFRAGTCIVESGDLSDPYTGSLIHFQRGRATSSLVQIDHVVALHDAWKSGASQWGSAQLMALGNDPLNLLAVQGKANQDKSDASADQWLPSRQQFRCAYAARQIAVKSRYGLSVTVGEKNALARVLHGCPGQPLPTENAVAIPSQQAEQG